MNVDLRKCVLGGTFSVVCVGILQAWRWGPDTDTDTDSILRYHRTRMGQPGCMKGMEEERSEVGG